MGIWVLRFGHRRLRDQRASTHVALTARALGASGVLFCGDEDEGMVEGVRKVVRQWGGPFEVRAISDWEGFARAFKARGGCFVHLTMYGQPVQKTMERIRKKTGECLVLVGSQKVPGAAYALADFNVAVTHQPHSEIAALAVFLDRYFEGKELKKRWRGTMRIRPMTRGKRVVRTTEG